MVTFRNSYLSRSLLKLETNPRIVLSQTRQSIPCMFCITVAYCDSGKLWTQLSYIVAKNKQVSLSLSLCLSLSLSVSLSLSLCLSLSLSLCLSLSLSFSLSLCLSIYLYFFYFFLRSKVDATCKISRPRINIYKSNTYELNNQNILAR